MSTHARRRHSPQRQHSNAGKRNGSVHTQTQRGVIPNGRADGADQPFPNKPVSHRRPVNPRTQDSLYPCDFENVSVTKQHRGPLSTQEHHTYDMRQSTASQHPRKDSQKVPSGELQMARAIHEKELMLQEKLRRAEEKIRQKIQRDSTYDAQRYDHESEEKRHSGSQKERGGALTKTRLSEQQRREPVRSREMTMQGKRQEDVRKRQDERSEDRVRDANKAERATWKRREVVHSPQPQRNISKGPPEHTVHGQEMSGALSKPKNVKERTRTNEEIKKSNGQIMKSQDGTEDEREQNTTSEDVKGWRREKKYSERTRKEMYDSDEEQEMPQMSQKKTSHRRPEQAELELTESPAASLQLLPCKLCNRKFVSERLEKHVQICKKVNQSHRPVFNSYINRTKGSAIEEFWKTHSRAKTPEVLKKKTLGRNHKSNTRNLHEGRLPAGPSQPKWSK